MGWTSRMRRPTRRHVSRGPGTFVHTVLTGGLHWLRAGVTQNTAAVCDLIDIKAQAVTAEFVDQNNDPDFLAQPLPAKTIKKLVVKQAALKSIIQPYIQM